MLKRASSVPSRGANEPDIELNTNSCDATNNQSDTFDVSTTRTIFGAPESTTTTKGLTPSTTDESVKCLSSQQQSSTSSSNIDHHPPTSTQQTNGTQNINAGQLLPHLPNITPLRGNTNYQGWL